MVTNILPYLGVLHVYTSTGVIQAEIVIYPVPQGIYYARHNDDYTVKVRQVGEKDWVDLYEYNVKVDMDTKSDATMVQFDFSGHPDAKVVFARWKIGSIRLRSSLSSWGWKAMIAAIVVSISQFSSMSNKRLS